MDKKIEKEGSFSALKHILSLANVCFLMCSFSVCVALHVKASLIELIFRKRILLKISQSLIPEQLSLLPFPDLGRWETQRQRQLPEYGSSLGINDSSLF